MFDKKMKSLAVALIAIAAFSVVLYTIPDDSTAADDVKVIDAEVVVKSGESYELTGTIEFKNGGKLVMESGSELKLGTAFTIIANGNDTILLKENSKVSIMGFGQNLAKNTLVGIEGQVKFSFTIAMIDGLSVNAMLEVAKGTITYNDTVIKINETTEFSIGGSLASMPDISSSNILNEIFKKGFYGTVYFNGSADISIQDVPVSVKGELRATIDMAVKSDKYLVTATGNLSSDVNMSEDTESLKGSFEMSGSFTADVTKAIPLINQSGTMDETLKTLFDNSTYDSKVSFGLIIDEMNMDYIDTNVKIEDASVKIVFSMADDASMTVKSSMTVNHANISVDDTVFDLKGLDMDVELIPTFTPTNNIPDLIPTDIKDPSKYLDLIAENFKISSKATISINSFTSDDNLKLNKLKLGLNADYKDNLLTGDATLEISGLQIVGEDSHINADGASFNGKFENMSISEKIFNFYDLIEMFDSFESSMNSMEIASGRNSMKADNLNVKNVANNVVVSADHVLLTIYFGIDNYVDCNKLELSNVFLENNVFKNLKFSYKVFYADGKVAEMKSDKIDVTLNSNTKFTNGTLTVTADEEYYSDFWGYVTLGEGAVLNIEDGKHAHIFSLTVEDGATINGKVLFDELKIGDVNLSNTDWGIFCYATFAVNKMTVTLEPQDGYIIKEWTEGAKYTLNEDGTATVTDTAGDISSASEGKKYGLYIDKEFMGEFPTDYRYVFPKSDDVFRYMDSNGSTYYYSIYMPANDIYLTSIPSVDLGAVTEDKKLDKDGFMCMMVEGTEVYRITLNNGVIFELSEEYSVSKALASLLEEHEGSGVAYGIYANGFAKILIPVDGFDNPVITHVGQYGLKEVMDSTPVTVDGKKYLQITTHTYSQYTVTESGNGNGISTYVIAIVIVILVMAVLVVLLKKKGKI